MSARPWQVAVFNTACAAAEQTGEWNTVLILKAMFAWNGTAPIRGPAYGPWADITPDGYVLTAYIDAHQVGKIKDVATVTELVENLRRLADAAKLDDDGTVALFDEARKWIRTDNRADDDKGKF